MKSAACMICGCALGDLAVVGCERCDTPHHQDCWDFNGGCAVYACNPATKADPIKKGGLRPGPASVVLLLAGLGTGLAFFGVHRLLHRTPVIQAVGVTAPVQMDDPSSPGGTIEVGPFVGMRAPDFRIRDREGRLVSLDELRAGRVAVLTFWLAYCGDCMPHVPAWAEIFERFEEDRDLTLVNVAAFARDPGPSLRFVEEYRVGGHVLLDAANKAVPLYGVGTITTLIIDEGGIIRYRGSQVDASADSIEKALARIRGR